MDPYPDFKGFFLLAPCFYKIPYFHSRFYGFFCVPWVRNGQTANGEIGIADGFYLLQPVTLHDVVEGGKTFVEFPDQLFWAKFFGRLGKADKIREQDADL